MLLLSQSTSITKTFLFAMSRGVVKGTHTKYYHHTLFAFARWQRTSRKPSREQRRLIGRSASSNNPSARATTRIFRVLLVLLCLGRRLVKDYFDACCATTTYAHHLLHPSRAPLASHTPRLVCCFWRESQAP